uniref:Uncharacterized protein n=1 Tax=Anguilla anguilla TaxID=7936 RepID=A0A0E9VEA8_ANGAN
MRNPTKHSLSAVKIRLSHWKPTDFLYVLQHQTEILK